MGRNAERARRFGAIVRLFFAVDLDDPARAAAEQVSGSLASRIAGLGAAVRWVRPAGLHLTLAFLGEVDRERLESITALGAAAFEQPPFDFSLSVAGVFPSRGTPRVIWIGPGRGGAEAANLSSRVWRRLDGAGYGPPPSRFDPHVTLGRVRRVRAGEARRLRGLLAETAPPAIAWTVDHVSLYESRPGSRGSTYRRLATAALRGGAA